jgi:hypothetical protein
MANGEKIAERCVDKPEYPFQGVLPLLLQASGGWFRFKCTFIV